MSENLFLIQIKT